MMMLLCCLDPIGDDENGEGIDLQQQKLPWEGTDRDYKYEEVCNILHIIYLMAWHIRFKL